MVLNDFDRHYVFYIKEWLFIPEKFSLVEF